MADNKLSAESLQEVAKWAANLERYFDPSGAQSETSYLVGELRVWHVDGFSPGYFTNKGEDFWWFVPDYTEDSTEGT